MPTHPPIAHSIANVTNSMATHSLKVHSTKTSPMAVRSLDPFGFSWPNCQRQSNGPTHFRMTFQPTDQPTESDRKLLRHPIEKVCKRDDSPFPQNKVFNDAMGPNQKIDTIYFFLHIFLQFFFWNLSALSPLTYSSRCAQAHFLLQLQRSAPQPALVTALCPLACLVAALGLHCVGLT